MAIRRLRLLEGRVAELRERREDPGLAHEDAASRRKGALRRPTSGKFLAKCRSFSAVSTLIFARKYAFCSIFQNPSDYLAEIFEIWQHFADFATFVICLLNFHKIADFSNRFLLKF